MTSEFAHRRPAAVQRRFDRGIPVHLEPVRRDPGPVDGRPGERDHQVGHESALGSVPDQLSRQPLQRAESGPGPGRADQQPAVSARRSAARSCGTGCTSSPTTNTSASRGPASGARRTRRSTSRLEGTNTQKMGGGRLDYQLSPRTRVMGKVSGGRLWEPFGLPAPPPTRRPRDTTEEYNDEIPRAVDAGAEQSGGERDQSREDRVRAHTNENLTKWSNHWQRAKGITTGSPRITFTGFSITGNQNFPRQHGPGRLERARRLHLFVQREGASRPADRRRVPAPGRAFAELPAVHGSDRRPWRPALAGQLEALVSRCVQRRHLEPGGALPDHAELHHRRRKLRRPSRLDKRSPPGRRTTGRSRIA